MTAYYNEIDPFAAQWLLELIQQGHIADGVVDTRSIEDVTPNDLKPFTQCHFFAGIGVWSYALRQAGWPDDRPIWTGSAPCQPFSSAGKGGGFADERHLWPAFHWLIHQCRPDIVLGEQVAGKDGLTWLDLVSNDLEKSGYACGASVTAACGFGAPHQRKRLYWVASNSVVNPPRIRLEGRGGEDGGGSAAGVRAGSDGPWGGGEPCILANAKSAGRETRGCHGMGDGESAAPPSAHAGEPGSRAGPTNSFWRDADWLGCRDGKWRAVEPGSFPLAHGATSRVGRLRGYGNAIVSEQAKAFIEAVMDSLPNA